jgi:hypothetical protein
LPEITEVNEVPAKEVQATDISTESTTSVAGGTKH